MMKLGSIGLALALALTGCADSSVDSAGGGDGSGSGPGSSEPPPEPLLELQGTYRVNSTFDLLTGMPGDRGAFLAGLVEATDDPDDPMSWLVDQMLASMDPGTLKDLLVAVKPLVIGALNDQVTTLAPDLVGTLTELGKRMDELFKKFGVDEKLVISTVDQTGTARVTVDGVRFEVESTSTSVLLADHDIDDVVVDPVLVTLEDKTRISIGEHTIALPYSKVVRLGLDLAAIPSIDASATSLADLLDNQVDCAGVGASVAQSIGLGSSAFWTTACIAGLSAAADQVYDALLGANDTLDLTIRGTARAVDANADYKLDKMASGVWTGTMTYQGASAPLAQPATFVGSRL